MENVFSIKSINQLNRLFGVEDMHPLISIIDFSTIKEMIKVDAKISSDLYAIMLKEQCVGTIKYGRQVYDFQSGTLVFIAPGQVVSIEEEINPSDNKDWGIFFHPDFLIGTSLAKRIKQYNFFLYDINEALHLSEKEKSTLTDLVGKMEDELSENIDKHSQTLITSNIELLLNYCVRYFDRQFITRSPKYQDVLMKFEQVLAGFIHSDTLIDNGLPTVHDLADKMHLSPNYLSDLLKKETGKGTLEHIHYGIIEEAKKRIILNTGSISEVAYELGFEYPQYFTRLFKKVVGMTPNTFKNSN